VRGNLDAMMRPMIAIVGSRNASAAGLKFAGVLARDLSDAGFVVTSGLARGIDQAAQSRLDRGRHGRGASRVVTTGSIRPNTPDLLHDLIVAGAAISEMPPGYVARAHDFPRRNRLVSGASLGVVRDRSRDAVGFADHRASPNEQGREVFRRAGLAARSAGRRHQRPDQTGRQR